MDLMTAQSVAVRLVPVSALQEETSARRASSGIGRSATHFTNCSFMAGLTRCSGISARDGMIYTDW
jgi:hypothetical protein